MSKLAPQVRLQYVDANGNPYSGAQLFTYITGTSTKQSTYQSSGGSANSNPIILDSAGRTPYGVWLTEGVTYRFVLAPSTDTDPPASPYWTVDGITGINDVGTSTVTGEWLTGYTCTYVANNQFSVVGDQSSAYHVGRRVRVGSVYSTITAVSYAAGVTTVTVDTTSYSNPLSGTADYGILSSSNPSVPKVALPSGSTATTQSAGDNSTKLATTAYVDTSNSTNIDPGVQDFRITLESGVPVSTTDQTAKTTLYACPYKGNRIALYNGSSWAICNSAQFSVALGTITSGMNYDVFCYSNSGTPTLEILSWSSTSARATALTYQDGVLVKSGSPTRRYLGTFYTTSTTTTEDSEQNRYVWNYYHRMPRTLKKLPSSTWTYGTAAWRQANASTSNQVNFVAGLVEDCVSIRSVVTAKNTSSGAAWVIGVGLNTTAGPTGVTGASAAASAGGENSSTATFESVPTLGLNYAAMLEYGTATGTMTFYGASGVHQSGIYGRINC